MKTYVFLALIPALTFAVTHIVHERAIEDCGYARIVVEDLLELDAWYAPIREKRQDERVMEQLVNKQSLYNRAIAKTDSYIFQSLAAWNGDLFQRFAELSTWEEALDVSDLRVEMVAAERKLFAFCPLLSGDPAPQEEVGTAKILTEPTRNHATFHSALKYVNARAGEAASKLAVVDHGKRALMLLDEENVCRLAATLKHFDAMQKVMDDACKGQVPGKECPIADRAFLNQETKLVEHLYVKGLGEYQNKWGASSGSGRDTICANTKAMFAYEK